METGDIEKYYCRVCGTETSSQILSHHEENWNLVYENIWGVDDYYIIQCKGCGNISFLKVSRDSENVGAILNPVTGEQKNGLVPSFTYWPPKMKRPRPNWLHDLRNEQNIRRLFDELYKALEHDAIVLTAIGIRTIFDAISTQLNIDQAKTFSEKLDDLFSNGNISRSERRSLEVLVDAGSAAAHRGWRPKPKDLNQLIDILEHFAQRVLLIDNNVNTLKTRIPPKPPRK